MNTGPWLRGTVPAFLLDLTFMILTPGRAEALMANREHRSTSIQKRCRRHSPPLARCPLLCSAYKLASKLASWNHRECSISRTLPHADHDVHPAGVDRNNSRGWFTQYGSACNPQRMTTPKSPEQLTAQIKAIVDNYLRESESAAVEAVIAAFSMSSSAQNKPVKTKPVSSARPRKNRWRRSEQLAELTEKLDAAIATQPGESMTLFAAQLGVSVRELHGPMTKLKKANRIRSVGERNRTRYFPAIITSIRD